MTIPGTETPLSAGYDAATRDDPVFAQHFRHGFTTIDGLQMHYVLGGQGPPLLLVPSFLGTWFSWWGLMPDLATRRTVIAVDPPGLGDSSGTPPAHDKVHLAHYVNQLLDRLGFQQNVDVAGFDFGAAIAYALATQWRDRYSRLMLMDFPITGGTLLFAQVQALSFHLGFHSQEPLFEQLVIGRERLWLEYIFRHLSPGNNQPIPPAAVDEFVRAYQRPGALHHGSRYYQAWPQDERDNQAAMRTPLTIPVRVLAQAPYLDDFLTSIRSAAPQATGVAFHTGHWFLHEAPEQVLEEMSAFFTTDR
ncbi:alpha/beta fold hydrolase [Mycobacterium sp. HNNTM2301]|uniref:alpha/beta fold hydrolase n=1 Tax=Mycobacterium hainanense TaxID=3289775 RepID=UPI0035A5CB92